MVVATQWREVNAKAPSYSSSDMSRLGLENASEFRYLVYILECAGPGSNSAAGAGTYWYMGIECQDEISSRLRGHVEGKLEEPNVTHC